MGRNVRSGGHGNRGREGMGQLLDDVAILRTRPVTGDGFDQARCTAYPDLEHSPLLVASPFLDGGFLQSVTQRQ